jgi:hypothetical protein
MYSLRRLSVQRSILGSLRLSQTLIFDWQVASELLDRTMATMARDFCEFWVDNRSFKIYNDASSSVPPGD